MCVRLGVSNEVVFAITRSTGSGCMMYVNGSFMCTVWHNQIKQSVVPAIHDAQQTFATNSSAAAAVGRCKPASAFHSDRNTLTQSPFIYLSAQFNRRCLAVVSIDSRRRHRRYCRHRRRRSRRHTPCPITVV